MSYEVMREGSLNYFPCRYGESRLLFRGPRRRLTSDYVACIGGTETYGKFIADPYAALLEQAVGMTCVNLGFLNASIDAFVRDEAVVEIAKNAKVTVIQVMGAQNLSNRFYSVHPRRNDRFVKPSRLMQSIFREIDFTEYHFTRHMLGALSSKAPDRYWYVRDELKSAWVARMKLMLQQISSKVVLLWFADHAPEEMTGQEGLGSDPMFVDRGMIEEMRPLVSDVVEVVVSAEALARRSEGMQCSQMEAVAAAHMLGPLAHREAAEALNRSLDPLLR